MMHMLHMIIYIVCFELNDVTAALNDLQMLPETVIGPVLYEFKLFITPCMIIGRSLKIVHITHTIGTITRPHQLQCSCRYLLHSQYRFTTLRKGQSAFTITLFYYHFLSYQCFLHHTINSVFSLNQIWIHYAKMAYH